MSHFTKIKTQIKDREALVAALQKVMGFRHLEVHDVPQHLYGYQADERPETAEVIIRREYIGRASNDVGFKLQPDGTYQAIVSKWDSGRFNDAWMGRLTQAYAYQVVKEQAEIMGLEIESEQVVNGEVRLVLGGWT